VVIKGVAITTALAVGVSITCSALAEDDFPIIGVYAKDQACRGNGSQQADALVRITAKEIESNMGTCTILSKTRQGNTFSVQVECKVPGDQTILGDVTFKVLDENTLDFDDQDHTSPAVLYKCGK
jgi:hypothetical protein